jgi:hypothetical protein
MHIAEPGLQVADVEVAARRHGPRPTTRMPERQQLHQLPRLHLFERQLMRQSA